MDRTVNVGGDVKIEALFRRLQGHKPVDATPVPNPQELTVATCEILRAKAREHAIHTCNLMQSEMLELIDSIRVYPNEGNAVGIDHYKAEGVKNYMKFLTADLDRDFDEQAHHKCGYCAVEFKGVFSGTLANNHEWATHPEECRKVAYIVGSALIYTVMKSLADWKPDDK